MPRTITRRDLCHLVAKRAGNLTTAQSIAAWAYLCGWLERMGSLDHARIPKFRELLRGIRKSTIHAKNL